MTRGTSKKGPQQKTSPDSLTVDRDAHSFLFRGDFSGRARLVFFFFVLRPRADAHSLTAGLGGDASRRGGVLCFAAAPPGR